MSRAKGDIPLQPSEPQASRRLMGALKDQQETPQVSSGQGASNRSPANAKMQPHVQGWERVITITPTPTPSPCPGREGTGAW